MMKNRVTSDDGEETATEPVLPIDSQHLAREPEEQDEEMEDLAGVKEGHFQEQFAAGHGGQEEGEEDVDLPYGD